MPDDIPQENDPSYQLPSSDEPSPDQSAYDASEYDEYTADRTVGFTPSREFVTRQSSASTNMPAPDLPELPALMDFLAQERQRKKKKQLYIWLTSAAVLLLVFAGSFVVLSGKFLPALSFSSFRPSFHASACPFTPASGMKEGRDVRCGFVTVLEDHSNTHGQTIQLAAAIFTAAGRVISHDPMLYLSGGPGGPALSDWGNYIDPSNVASITLGHDLIFVDQRGTGFSKPSLNCPELDNYRHAIDENTTDEEAISLYTKAVQGCHDRLTLFGVHLNTYTTIEDATDIHDVIHALGYQQVHLYGVSYGTQLALTVMRLFPADLLSVILDSTVPLQLNTVTSEPATIQHAYDTLFKGCEASQHCHSLYPDLEKTFYSLVDSLNEAPASFVDKEVGKVQLSGDDLADWVFNALYVTSFIPELPKDIMQISKGDFTSLSQNFDRFALHEDEVSEGMNWSVDCGEQVNFTVPDDLDRAVNVMRPELRDGEYAKLRSQQLDCRLWNQPTAPPEQKQPVKSSIPTLLLSGEFDPITPTSYAQEVMQTLSDSYLFVFPALGHGVFTEHDCPGSIMQAFMQHPTAKPDSGCIGSMPEPDFQ